MPPWLASHLICELYHDIIFLLRVKFVNDFSTFNYSSCASAIRHGHGQNLEWKQGLQSRQCYVTKHMSCWLQIAPRGRIQRQMTSPIPPPEVHALTWQGYVARAYGILHCYVICLV